MSHGMSIGLRCYDGIRIKYRTTIANPYTKLQNLSSRTVIHCGHCHLAQIYGALIIF